MDDSGLQPILQRVLLRLHRQPQTHLIARRSSFSGSYFGFIGNLNHAFLWNIKNNWSIKNNDTHRAGSAIPEMLFVMFEMAFAIITTGVIAGLAAVTPAAG